MRSLLLICLRSRKRTQNNFEIVQRHAIPLPLEVLKHARTYFITRRMNLDELDDWFHDIESTV